MLLRQRSGGETTRGERIVVGFTNIDYDNDNDNDTCG